MIEVNQFDKNVSPTQKELLMFISNSVALSIATRLLAERTMHTFQMYIEVQLEFNNSLIRKIITISL